MTTSDIRLHIKEYLDGQTTRDEFYKWLGDNFDRPMLQEPPEIRALIAKASFAMAALKTKLASKEEIDRFMAALLDEDGNSVLQ